MKVLVFTEDILLQHFLYGLLTEAEGVQVAFAEELAGSPDGESGWLLALASEDRTAEQCETLIAEDWLTGIVLFRTGNSRPERNSTEGPYSDTEGVLELSLPADISRIIEAFQGAYAAGRALAHDGPQERACILVAEDSPLQRQLVASTLKSEGYQVVEAEDGQVALDFLGDSDVDLVITDVEMPRMTGHELTRTIRGDGRLNAIPVLMLTTLSGFDEIKAGFDAGASDYLVKPKKGERELFLEELLDRVSNLLSQSLPEGERRALVVDDSNLTRRMVAGAMTRVGFQVTTAEDGSQAKGLLDSPAISLPDIVVTDLEMPVMDGLRLTHYIKNNERTQHLPVIILSASTLHEHRVLGKGFGVDAFISKPFSEEKLQVTVDQVLVRNRLENEKREISAIMGRDVVKAIHQGGLEPRTREMTILFSDLAGFSKMCFGMDAASVVSLLNDYFGRFVEFVLREQGYVNKFIGDALMALFSTLPGLAPPQVRAARAAIAFQKEMQQTNREASEPLRTRIGINTGEVILGLIGGGERKDYTVIGDNVNRAQRLESKAPVDGILLSEGTYSAVEALLASDDGIEVTPVRGLELKGIARPVTAYAVTIKEQA